MKLDKVYIGYTKDYKEHLLEDRGSYYLDLLTNNIIFRKDLLLGLLKPISVLDNKHRSMLLSSLKRLYEKDRNMKIDTTKLFIGDVYQAKKINYEESFGEDILDMVTHTNFNFMVLKKDVLLYKINRKQYKNIKTDEEYIMPLYPKRGSLYIDEEELVNFNDELISTNIRLSNTTGHDIVVNQTKKKVLESYHYILGNK